MRRVAVIGLDGVPWKVVNKLHSDGVIKHLAELREEGAHGHLASIIPPFTVPAWTSMSTGVNPGKHGAYATHALRSDYSLRLLTSRDVHYPRVYEILTMKGFRSVVVNLPLSYPPAVFRGVMLSDWLYPRRAVYPPEAEELAEDYTPPDPLWALQNPANYAVKVMKGLKGMIKTLKRLFKEVEWSLFYAVFSETDFLLHRNYDEIMSSDGNSPAREVFRRIDRFIGWMMDKTCGDSLLLVVSDHGFTKYRYVVHLNSLLREGGYIRVKSRWRASTSLSRLPVPKFFYRYVQRSRNMRRLVGPILDLLGFGSASFYLKIPTSDSYAFAPPDYFGVYINSKDVFEEWPLEDWKTSVLRKRIIRLFNSLRNPKNGDKVFRGVYARENLFHGPHVNKIPHVVLIPGPQYWMDHEMAGDVIEEGSHVDHSLWGLFAAYGSDVNAGVKLRGISLLDVTPTILHYLGLPIGREMDGTPILDAFREGSDARSRPVIKADYLRRWRATLRMRRLRRKLKRS